jgi:hypothetical protein
LLSNGSRDKPLNCSRIILLLSSSSPLLITSVNVPEPVFALVISYLTLLSDPEGSNPVALPVDSLF